MPRSLVALVPLTAVLVGGCHPSPPPARSSSAAAAAPAGMLAALFGGDRTLTYDVHAEDSSWDDQDPTADADGNVHRISDAVVTCQQRVTTRGALWVATIRCDDGALPDGLRGQLEAVNITDGRALWRLEPGSAIDDDAALTLAMRSPPALTITQQPVDRTTTDPDEGDRFGARHTVAPIDDGWCVDDTSWGGDESDAGWCLSGARGLVSASWSWAGGSSHEATATLR